MLTYYGSSISQNITETPEGYLIARNVPIARTGMQEYLARELGLDGDGERLVKVYRHPEDVFDRAAIASFEGKPLTDEHPPEGVDATNHAAYSKGHLQNVRRENERLVADLVIHDPALVSEVKNAVKREVSCGYNCDYIPDGDGYKQTNIRGNHVAVVHRGRAGHDVAIKDSAPVARKGTKTMTLAELFGLTVSQPTATQDAEPVEMTPDAKPAAETTAEPAPALDAKKSKDEDIPKGDDLGSKLDKLIERIDTIEKRLNGHGGAEEDKKPADEKTIDAELTKLSGEKPDDEPSEVIEAEEKTEMEGDACGSNDAAVSILKAVRPAVAAITDAKQKAAVVDALLTSIGGGGCGPTSAAMLIETLTGKTCLPTETMEWACESGYVTAGHGTDYAYFKPQFARYGLKCEMLTWSKCMNVGSWVRYKVEEMLKGGGYRDMQGRPADMDLSRDMLRLLVWNDRAGMYG